MYKFTKYANINVGNITWNLFFLETVFPLWIASIECWLLLPHLLN